MDTKQLKDCVCPICENNGFIQPWTLSDLGLCMCNSCGGIFEPKRLQDWNYEYDRKMNRDSQKGLALEY